ncbi:hypothetical protein SeLEV6574_g05233 [Synchytrium endobioticum]|uniref:Uncharacterized protein n=1 Tax=Synchytrium endobioticum TaxID=286115 RepID=A0A507CVG0_9FUNG|nr:hypothetical protein SeLEV6574_g05233 [Synchytrium endobioticum]
MILQDQGSDDSYDTTPDLPLICPSSPTMEPSKPLKHETITLDVNAVNSIQDRLSDLESGHFASVAARNHVAADVVHLSRRVTGLEYMMDNVEGNIRAFLYRITHLEQCVSDMSSTQAMDAGSEALRSVIQDMVAREVKRQVTREVNKQVAREVGKQVTQFITSMITVTGVTGVLSHDVYGEYV